MHHYGQLEGLAADRIRSRFTEAEECRLARRARTDSGTVADEQRRGRIKAATAPRSSPVGDAYQLRHPSIRLQRRTS
jgi:hypothetical protein